jgi:hypothetical protein
LALKLAINEFLLASSLYTFTMSFELLLALSGQSSIGAIKIIHGISANRARNAIFVIQHSEANNHSIEIERVVAT